jgi:hypothetical protein
MGAGFNIVELGDDPSGLWNRLLDGSPQATVFCQRVFSEALAEATGRGYRLVVCCRGDKPIAGLPLYESRRAGAVMVWPPPLVPHLGLVTSADVERDHPRSREFNVFEACRALSDWLGRRYDHVSFSQHPGLADVRPFLWEGFEERLCYTYRIGLADWSLDALHSSTRNKITRARKEEVRVEESTNLRHILEMVEMSYSRRARSAPFGRKYLEILFRHLSGQGAAKLYYARDSTGKAVSGRIALESFNVVYDWVAGADPAHYASAATPLLLYSIIDSSRGGHEFFDLMGANTPSIAAFKSNFGGRITPYYVTSKTLSARGSLALFSREVLKHFKR